MMPIIHSAAEPTVPTPHSDTPATASGPVPRKATRATNQFAPVIAGMKKGAAATKKPTVRLGITDADGNLTAQYKRTRRGDVMKPSVAPTTTPKK